MSVIFGPQGPPAKAFSDAVDAGEDAYNALQRIAGEREDHPSDEYVKQQVREYFKEDRTRLERARESFAEAQARFEEAVS